jgi:MFS transporter, AAHS family, 4-hydroxybenzoate transporter
VLGLVAGCGFCIIGGQTGLNGVAVTIYPTFLRSSGAGWVNGIGRIGGIIAPVAGGLLLSFMWPLHKLFLAAALPLALASLSIFMLARFCNIQERKQERQETHDTLDDSSSTPLDEIS